MKRAEVKQIDVEMEEESEKPIDFDWKHLQGEQRTTVEELFAKKENVFRNIKMILDM